MPMMESLLVRFMVSGLLAVTALREFFAPALTLAYRTGALGTAERLGRGTAGDDYRRFIPLMEAVPAWLLGVWILAGLLYLAAIGFVLRRRRGGHILVLSAIALEFAGMLLSRPIEAATGVIVNLNPNPVATVVFPYVMPLGVALVLWHDRRTNAGSRVSVA